MQVDVDVTYIHTNFGGRDLFNFGDIATFKSGHFSLSTHGLYIVHGHQKINQSESAQKNHACRCNVTCMHTKFGGRDHGLENM